MTGFTDAIVIVVIVAASQGLGWIAERLGQPRVLGELTTGLVLGASLLGVVDPHEPGIAAVAELGLLVLLFEIGLETDARALARLGRPAIWVGATGVVLPLALGTAAALLFRLTWVESLMCGAALTATSIGISARVLQQLGQLHSTEGRVVLGAAVLDDVAGLVLLAVVSALASTSTGSDTGATDTVSHTLASIALLAAFAAGMVLHRTRWQRQTARGVRVLGFVVVPVFFAAVGAGVVVQSVGGFRTMALALTLLLVGVAGKFASGYTAPRFPGRRAVVGLAMVPRGEVGLVFASTASALGVFDQTLYSVVTLVVMATTFLTPPVLARIARR